MTCTNPYIHTYCVNLRDGAQIRRERQPLSSGDKNADVFVVRLQDSGKDVDLSGTAVTGKVIRPDGQTVPLTGDVVNGAAQITLDEYCYAVPGEIKLTITVSMGTIVQSLLIVSMDVQTSETSVIVDNGVIGTLTELLAAIANMQTATEETRAATKEALQAAQSSVRVDTAQNLSSAQKLQARTNIGAASIDDITQGTVVRADTAQNLSSAQKLQARTNIGAASIDDISSASDAAPPIIIQESGVLAQTKYAAMGKKISKLRLMGQSEQETAPSPDTPADIVAPGDGTNILLEVCGVNLYNTDTITTTTSSTSKATYTVGSDGWVDVTSKKKYDYINNKRYFAAGLTYTLRFEVEVYDRPADSTNETKIVVNVTTAKMESITANGKYTYFVYFEPEKSGFYTILTHANYNSAEPAKVKFRTTCVIGRYTYSTMPAWTPYGDQTVTLPYQLFAVPTVSEGNYIDTSGKHWITDEIDFERGVYIQRTKHLSVDGSGAWSSRVPNSGCFKLSITDSAISVGVMETTGVICNRLVTSTYSNVLSSNIDNTIAAYGTGIYINIPDEHNSLALAMLWLDEHPLEIVYALETPVETPLDAHVIAEYNRLLSADSIIAGGAIVDIGYIADTKKYIDLKFTELANQMLNS